MHPAARTALAHFGGKPRRLFQKGGQATNVHALATTCQELCQQIEGNQNDGCGCHQMVDKEMDNLAMTVSQRRKHQTPLQHPHRRVFMHAFEKDPKSAALVCNMACEQDPQPRECKNRCALVASAITHEGFLPEEGNPSRPFAIAFTVLFGTIIAGTIFYKGSKYFNENFRSKK